MIKSNLLRGYPVLLGVVLAGSIAASGQTTIVGPATVTGGASTGNLNVTGAIDSDSNSLTFGTQGATFGAALIYADNSMPAPGTGDTFKFSLNRTPASWLWIHNASIAAMRLDSAHQLLLYNAAGTAAGLTFTPVSSQISFGSATLTGSGTGLTAGGAFTVAGNFTNSNGSFTGGSSGLNFNAGAANQNISFTTPSGTGDIVFNTAGAERARIKSSGLMGIGTTAPLQLLHVNGGNAAILVTDSNTGGGVFRLGAADGSRGQWAYDGSANSYLDFAQTFRIRSLTGGTYDRLNILSNGNVGLGTASPAGKFHVVAGSAREVVTYIPTSASGIADFSVGGVGWEFSRPEDGAFTHGIYSYNSVGGAKNNLAISSRSDIVFTAGNGGPDSAPERMRISTTGKVGIGTSSPRSRLDLGGTLGAGNGAMFGDYLEINERETINNASTIGWNAYVAADDGTFAPVWAAGTGMVLSMSGGGTADLDFWGRNWGGSATPVNLNAFTHVMRLSTNGNIGIGTTSPSTKLDVVGQGQFSVDGVGADTASYGTLGVTRTASANTLSYIAMTRSGNAVKAMGIDASNRWVFGVPTAGTQVITTPQIVIEQTGNVGIGTTTPSQKLSVNGTIRAKEVIVDTGWSDYVFDESYRLAPLSEVEAHIKSEKHLPGIPSAQEIAEHGVSMGDMQSKLLAKIEELTLHVIEQEKRFVLQQGEIAALRHQLAELRTDNLR